jgi:hypothetical protein
MIGHTKILSNKRYRPHLERDINHIPLLDRSRPLKWFRCSSTRLGSLSINAMVLTALTLPLVNESVAQLFEDMQIMTLTWKKHLPKLAGYPRLGKVPKAARRKENRGKTRRKLLLFNVAVVPVTTNGSCRRVKGKGGRCVELVLEAVVGMLLGGCN